MAGYKLSQLADADFEAIYLYGILNFGLQQADTYADGMETHFSYLAAQPYQYPAVEHLLKLSPQRLW